ncbi:MAG: glycosyl hydrolase [Blastocatellia bacterium]|nr:glycosyl hydrolase [Blastocatellia bacterium]
MTLRLTLMLALAAVAGAGAQRWETQQSGTTAAFRGLSAVSDQVAWASGTKGTFLRTVDGGRTWQTGAVAGAEALDFRDVDAFDAQTACLLSIGKGEASRIYRTTDGGKTWGLQFKNSDPEAFFDAMAFWDRRHGIAMSDPVDGRFVILTTDDGGATWTRQPAERMPPALPNEGGFAASGTCITVEGRSNVWFGTGGARAARVFRSTDRGRTWTVAETPLLAGIPSAGVFSLAFRDARNGVAVGGDYQKPPGTERTLAFTSDGGLNWRLPDGPTPAGFRSGVVWLRGGALVAVGTSGSDYSSNGVDWTPLDQENYNVVAIARSGAIWAAGPRGRIAKLLMTK